MHRPRAMVFGSVTGPAGTKPIYARIDIGSDETLLGEDVASAIGIDLSHAPAIPFGGIVQGGYTARFAQVKLRLTDGVEYREWPAWVGFVSGLRRPVLGFGGCLQFFTTIHHGDDEAFELKTNRLYPGI